MNTIAQQWADYALGLRFEDIPGPVVQHMKGILLDTVGCALGAYGNAAQLAIQGAAQTDLTGRQEATVIGSGWRTTALNAILLNGSMIRYLDANDTAMGGHNSEIFGSALAVGERQGASGAEVLTSTIAGYELAARFHRGIEASSNAVAGKELEQLGWNQDLRGGYILPPVLGRLLGLDRAAIANAIGIAGSRSALLGIIDASKEQNTLAKNLRMPLTAYMALTSTYLAAHGLTGPNRVIEGHMGFNETVMHGSMDLTKLTDFSADWFTLRAGLKAFSACYATHGHVQATIDLARDVDLDPDQVESIRIVTNSRTLWHTGDPTTRRRVANKETADHSSYYVTAVAILFRSVTPEHYTEVLYADPRVHRLMDMVSIEADDSEYKEVYPGGRVEITLNDGQTLVREVRHPRGHHLSPMTDADIEEKFRGMARPHLSTTEQDEVIAAVRDFDTAPDPSRLMAALTIRSAA